MFYSVLIFQFDPLLVYCLEQAIGDFFFKLLAIAYCEVERDHSLLNLHFQMTF